MVGRYVIYIGVGISVTAIIGLSVWGFLGPLAGGIFGAVYKPDIHLTAQSFDVGACRSGSWGPFPWGQITDIQANLTFSNDGNAPGKATVTFTEDGNPIGGNPSTFLVQAGQTTLQTAQIQVGDCLTHTYHAQISGVTTA